MRAASPLPACVAGLVALLALLVRPHTAQPARADAAAPVSARAAAAPSMQLFGPGGVEGTLVALISSARARVLVEAYALSDAAVSAALQAAEHRGVDVRVMLDPQGLNTATTQSDLQSAGIRIRSPNPAYAVSHLDDVVVDAGAVAIVTAALTVDDLGPAGHAYLVIDRDRADVLRAAGIFYDDWLRRAVTYAGHNLILLPDDAPAITSLIDQAGSRLELYTSYLSDPGIVASLRAARGRGAVVRVLTPHSSDNAALLLVARRGAVRFRDDGAGTVLVVDRHTMLLGSMDLTTNTLTAHRELGVVLSGGAVTALVDRAFFDEFARGAALVLPIPPKPRRPNSVTVGSLTVSVDVSRVVRPGGEGVIVVTTAAGALVDIAITYPAGSRPGPGTSGFRSRAGTHGTVLYRWILSGHVTPGLAHVRIRVQLRGTVALYAASFTVRR